MKLISLALFLFVQFLLPASATTNWHKIYECSAVKGRLAHGFDLFSASQIETLAKSATRVKITPSSGDHENYTVTSLPNTTPILNLRLGLELSFTMMQLDGALGYRKLAYTNMSEWNGTSMAVARLDTTCGIGAFALPIRQANLVSASTPRLSVGLGWYSADCNANGIHMFSFWRTHSRDSTETMSSRCEWGDLDYFGGGISIYLDVDVATVLPHHHGHHAHAQTQNITEEEITIDGELDMEAPGSGRAALQLTDYCTQSQLFIMLEQTFAERLEPHAHSAQILHDWTCAVVSGKTNVIGVSIKWRVNFTVSQLANAELFSDGMIRNFSDTFLQRNGYTYVNNFTIHHVHRAHHGFYPVMPDGNTTTTGIPGGVSTVESDPKPSLTVLNIIFIVIIAVLCCCVLVLLCLLRQEKNKSSDTGTGISKQSGARHQVVPVGDEGVRFKGGR